MNKQHGFRFGVLEVAGIGFAAGVLGGVVASLAGGAFDTVVPCAAAFGAVGVPALWFGVGLRLSRMIRRPRAAHTVASSTRLVA